MTDDTEAASEISDLSEVELLRRLVQCVEDGRVSEAIVPGNGSWLPAVPAPAIASWRRSMLRAVKVIAVCVVILTVLTIVGAAIAVDQSVQVQRALSLTDDASATDTGEGSGNVGYQACVDGDNGSEAECAQRWLDE